MDLTRQMDSLERKSLRGLILSMSISSSSYSRRGKHTCSKTMDVSHTGRTYTPSRLDSQERILETIQAVVIPSRPKDAFRLLLSVRSHLFSLRQTKPPDALHTIDQHRRTHRPDPTPTAKDFLGSTRFSNIPCYLKWLGWIPYVPYVGPQDRSQAYTKGCARMSHQA